MLYIYYSKIPYFKSEVFASWRLGAKSLTSLISLPYSKSETFASLRLGVRSLTPSSRLGVKSLTRVSPVPIGQTGLSEPLPHQGRRCQEGRGRPKCRDRLRRPGEGMAPSLPRPDS
jgi:hypothetical protein